MMDNAVEPAPVAIPIPAPAAKRKYFPVMPSTWDPATFSLGRIETICPELLERIIDEERNVDQLKTLLVDVQGQMILLDRVGQEAERNGPFEEEDLEHVTAGLKATIAAAQGAPTEASPFQADPSWKGPYTQQLEEAFAQGLDLAAPLDASLPSLSYAAKWHRDRHDAMLKACPEVASLVKSATACPLSILIGLLAAGLHAYTLVVYLPRLWFRVMLATSAAKQDLVQNFTLASVLQSYSLGDVAPLLTTIESIVSVFSPFAVMGNWMEVMLADTFKVVGAFFLTLHMVLLAVVWGWWTTTAIHVMTCEVAMETVGSWLAVDTGKPSRHPLVQHLRYAVKHAVALCMQCMLVTGAFLEHALLGYRGHVEFLGCGEVLQGQIRTLCGVPTHTGHIDGALALPHNLILQQRRWKAAFCDKHGVSFKAFPPKVVKAARIRPFVSRLDLLREESRLLENNGEHLGPGMSLLDASSMAAYMQAELDAQAAATASGNHLEMQYGMEKRAMSKIMLFAKEFYTVVRGASPVDFKLLSSRGNFKTVDPRPLSSLVELDHPSVRPTMYKPFTIDRMPCTALRAYPNLSYALRDSFYVLVFYWQHLTSSVTTLVPMAIGLVVMYVLAVLQEVPGYRQTLGRAMRVFGRRYQRDNHGMFLSVTGCRLFATKLVCLTWQGVRYILAMVMWWSLVFAHVKDTDMSGLGVSSWMAAILILGFVLLYAMLSELFAMGFLWHPMHFILTTGHLSLKRESPSQQAGTVKDDVSQPTVSMYSTLWFWLSFGQTHHVEQHDFPRMPWLHRRHLAGKAPRFYLQDIDHHDGLVSVVRTYTQNIGEAVYAAHDTR